MQLMEPLHICLLAIEHRYPHHTIDLNEAVVPFRGAPVEGWTALALLDYLRSKRPDLFAVPASLIVDEQMSEIYLSDCSEQAPAFFIHCRGNIPIVTKEKVLIC